MKAMKIQILGVELKAALLNPAVAKQYENGFNNTLKRIRNAADDKTKSGVERLTEQCNAVIEFVDDMFGKGAAKSVFGEETDLLTCLGALEEMAVLYERQIAPVIREQVQRINPLLKSNAAKEDGVDDSM